MVRLKQSETVVVIRELNKGFEVAALWFDTVYDLIGTTRTVTAFGLPAYDSPDGIGKPYEALEEIDLADPQFELTDEEAKSIYQYCLTNQLFKP